MTVSLIITTFNNPEALFLVFKSLENQVLMPDEVIIADDGSSNETKQVIDNFKKNSLHKIIHSWQQDNGFRAAKSRNKAIAKSSSEYIVMVDGDMILHPRFIQDHVNNALKGFYIQGSRVLLSKRRTKEVFLTKQLQISFFSNGLNNKKNAIHSTFLSKVYSNKEKNIKSVRSCNMGFYRDDCININGFNNNFEGWGREDSEFIARLLNSGIKRKNVRFNLIQYHLWHEDLSRASLEKNSLILESTVVNKSIWCENGINTYLKVSSK